MSQYVAKGDDEVAIRYALKDFRRGLAQLPKSVACDFKLSFYRSPSQIIGEVGLKILIFQKAGNLAQCDQREIEIDVRPPLHRR